MSLNKYFIESYRGGFRDGEDYQVLYIGEDGRTYVKRKHLSKWAAEDMCRELNKEFREQMMREFKREMREML